MKITITYVRRNAFGYIDLAKDECYNTSLQDLKTAFKFFSLIKFNYEKDLKDIISLKYDIQHTYLKIDDKTSICYSSVEDFNNDILTIYTKVNPIYFDERKIKFIDYWLGFIEKQIKENNITDANIDNMVFI